MNFFSPTTFQKATITVVIQSVYFITHIAGVFRLMRNYFSSHVLFFLTYINTSLLPCIVIYAHITVNVCEPLVISLIIHTGYLLSFLYHNLTSAMLNIFFRSMRIQASFIPDLASVCEQKNML